MSLLSIQYPILLAGMGGISVPPLAAAVSNEGGLGVLGGGTLSPAELDGWIRDIRELTSAPFGVDTLLPPRVPESSTKEELEKMIPDEYVEFASTFRIERGIPEVAVERPVLTDNYFREQIEVIIENGVPVYAAGLGMPTPSEVAAMHKRGMTLIGIAGSEKHAIRHVEAGADVVVAQGFDAGGHNSSIGTMSLVPAVVDAVGPQVPVIAAGGIGDPRQIVAAMSLGASGVWVGTAFLFSQEARLPVFQKRLLQQAVAADTIVTSSVTGKPCRWLKNEWSAEFDRSDLKPLEMPLMGLVAEPVRQGAAAIGLSSVSVPPAGQSVGFSRTIRSASEIFRDLAAGVDELLQGDQLFKVWPKAGTAS